MHLFLALALVGAGSTYLMASAAPPPQLSSLHVPQMIPAGTILPFAGDSVPAGYMLCDGQELARAQYPQLFEAIGPAWGSATNFTFTLPDLRGRFLRGVSGASTNDPDRNSRTAIAPGGNVGNMVGTVQGDGRRGFSGTFSGTTATAGAHSHDIFTNQDDWDECCQGVSFANDGGGLGNFKDTEPAGSHSHNFSVNVAFNGEAETRPKNAYVNYIIKL